MLYYWKNIPPMKSLLAVEAAARHESFSRAAKELNVTQSAVSHSVTAAEKFLGIRLFDRRTRPISLTQEGEQYLSTLAFCLSRLSAEAVELKRETPSNEITVSCNLALGTYWLLPRLGAFHEQNPDLHVNMVTTYQGLAQLRDGTDLALRYGLDDWDGNQSIPLYREKIVPVATPEYLARNPTIECHKDLLEHTLLHASSEDRSWFDWHQWFAHFDIPVVSNLSGPTFDNHLMMMQSTLTGRGIALGWICTANDFLASGQLVPVLDDVISLEGAVHVVTQRTPNRGTSKFLSWLTELAEQQEIFLVS